MARCPSCGHESDLDTYICDNCEYQLKVERIEAIPLFRRPTERIYKPDNVFKRLIKIINPLTTSYAFRDINKSKDKKGQRLNIWINGFIIGLWALAVSWNLSISSYNNSDAGWVAFLNNFAIFLVFFFFGVLYYFVVIRLYHFAFSLAANFAVQLDGILAIRFNVKLKKNALSETLSGRSRVEKRAGIQSDISFDLSQKKKMLTSISQTGKYRVMGYAYAPLIVINLISFFWIWFFLPTQSIGDGNTLNFADMFDIWSSKVWIVIDVLQLIGILWVALTVTVAQREIGNTNTTRLLIGNLIVACIIGFTTIILRPALGGGNLNLTQQLTG